MLNLLKTKFFFNSGLKSRAGFTMIELLVSISIIGIVSGVFLANFHYANQRGKLNMAVQKLASDIRLMQGYALGQKDFKGSLPGGGWGVYLQRGEPTYYYIFADFGDGVGGNFDHAYEPGELLNKIDFPEGVTINQITIDSVSKATLHITFEPPDPKGWICQNAGQCGTLGSADNAEITLTDSSGNNQRVVKVNIFGLIDAEN